MAIFNNSDRIGRKLVLSPDGQIQMSDGGSVSSYLKGHESLKKPLAQSKDGYLEINVICRDTLEELIRKAEAYDFQEAEKHGFNICA